jgi:hypothetical protein
LGRNNITTNLAATPSHIALMRDTLFQHFGKMLRILDNESSLVGFGGLDDNPIKGQTSVLSVEQVLNAKLTGFNTSEQV